MTDFLEEDLCLCALNTILGDKPRIANEIISALGSASALFDMSLRDLKLIFPRGSYLPYTISRFDMGIARKQLNIAHSEGLRFISQKSKSYRTLLRQCPDRPCGLFSSEDIGDNEQERNILLCVSEPLDATGKKSFMHLISNLLKDNKKTLFHLLCNSHSDIKLAMDASLTGAAIAIIPENSIIEFYHLHAKEIDKILNQNPKNRIFNDIPAGNCLIPYRHERSYRIASGSCHCSVLFNGRNPSRSTRCARLSFSYDRDVYAFPGRICDQDFHGNNLLIATDIANMIISTDWLAQEIKNQAHHCRY